MTVTRPFHRTPEDYLISEHPDDPVLFLSPEKLHATAHQFLDGFPGFVTYAVKANPAEAVIGNLLSAGLSGFDVASPAEIALVRSLAPQTALHYNNPVRSRDEIAFAIQSGVTSYSVDEARELAKLSECAVPRGTEVAVRYKLPIAGAAYDFGEKFGTSPKEAADLLAEVIRLGYRPALTFHPGTQCKDPAAWEAYIHRAVDIAHAAGANVERLNVGGGFPAQRMQDDSVSLEAIFAAIERATRAAFGSAAPRLICEPGRAMVADAVSLALRIKGMKGRDQIYLNDGIYGTMAEQPVIGMTDRLHVIGPDGNTRRGRPTPRTLWGPTCDSLDRIPGTVCLPEDAEEGDYLMVHGMGAYSTATVTRFNGYGGLRLATVQRLNTV